VNSFRSTNLGLNFCKLLFTLLTCQLKKRWNAFSKSEKNNVTSSKYATSGRCRRAMSERNSRYGAYVFVKIELVELFDRLAVQLGREVAEPRRQRPPGLELRVGLEVVARSLGGCGLGRRGPSSCGLGWRSSRGAGAAVGSASCSCLAWRSSRTLRSIFVSDSLVKTPRQPRIVQVSLPVSVSTANFSASSRCQNPGARFKKYLTTILRSRYDNAKVTIVTKDRRLIYETPYEERKAFVRYDLLAKSKDGLR